MIAGSGSVIADVIRLMPMRMELPTFSLKTLFITVAIGCLLIAADQAYARWYRARFQYFNEHAFVIGISNGDSLDDTLAKFNDFEACVKIGPDMQPIQFPNPNPDRLNPTANWNLQVGDACYMVYQHDPDNGCRRRAWKMIFRNDKLIEWPRIDPEVYAKRDNHPVPHRLLRYGLLPLALPFLLLLGVVAAMSRKPKQLDAG